MAGWSGSNRPNYDLYNHEVTINMGGENKDSQENKEVKERPRWMVESTVDGAVTEKETTVGSMESKQTAGANSKSQKQDQGEIMRALLVHERKSGGKPNIVAAALSENESDESASDDDFPNSSSVTKRDERMEMDEVDDEEEEEEVMVSVRGQMLPFSEVTEHYVAEMTPEEKDIYIKLAQEAYAAMHD